MTVWNRLGLLLILAGAGFCVASVLIRLAGHSHVNGYETMSFFIGGMALLLTACVIKLYMNRQP